MAKKKSGSKPKKKQELKTLKCSVMQQGKNGKKQRKKHEVRS